MRSALSDLVIVGAGAPRRSDRNQARLLRKGRGLWGMRYVRAVASDERQTIRLEDDEGGHLHATWARSGKRLIVTVGRRGDRAQVELRPVQVDELARYLTAAE